MNNTRSSGTVEPPRQAPSVLSDPDPAAELKRAGLDKPGGRVPLTRMEPPSDEAKGLAWRLCTKALEELRANGTLRFETDGSPVAATFAEAMEKDAFFSGLPLVTSSMPSALQHRILAEIVDAELGVHHPDASADDRAAGLAILANYVKIEDQLWRLAGAERMPYAVTYYAASWFSRPDDVAIAGDLRLCARCGQVDEARRVKTTNAPTARLCGYCAAHQGKKDANGLLPAPPKHAICPAHKSRWWLRCCNPDCGKAFIGRSSQLYCPDDQLSKKGHAERRAIMASPLRTSYPWPYTGKGT